MTLDHALTLEKEMWEAAKNRDAVRFLELVSPEAVMVCGGYRCTGKEYAEVIRDFDCRSYSLEDYEIVHADETSFQVHYLIKTEVENEQNRDLAGMFHITTTWAFFNGNWQVIFNMDHKIM